jgi:hypothetical protein
MLSGPAAFRPCDYLLPDRWCYRPLEAPAPACVYLLDESFTP